MTPKYMTVEKRNTFINNPPAGCEDAAAHILFLERKLTETEARSWGRLLATVEEFSKSNPSYVPLLNAIRQKEELDPLHLERMLADEANYKAEVYEGVFNAAREFKQVHDLYASAESIANSIRATKEEIRDAIEMRTRMLVKREKLFSLIEEAQIKIRL